MCLTNMLVPLVMSLGFFLDLGATHFVDLWTDLHWPPLLQVQVDTATIRIFDDLHFQDCPTAGRLCPTDSWP